jgi:hypothetical protein
MALDQPRGQFGVHSLCLFDPDTSLKLSYLQVLGEFTMNFEAEWAELEGGSNLYVWDAEVSKINSDMNLVCREYDGATMALFMGGSHTDGSAESTGSTSGFANVKGTSVYDVSTGLTAVSVTTSDEGDLKEGKYVVKATGTDTAELYCLTDVDFQRGTDAVFEDNTLKIDDLDFSGGDAVSADFGLTFEVGSGATNFTTNDTAAFYVRKPNSSYSIVTFGQKGAEFSSVGVYVAGQRQSDGSIFTMELPRCRVAGMPIAFTEKAWSEWNVTIKALYDSTTNSVGTARQTFAV